MRFLVPREAVSWVDYDSESPFPIQNLPFGAFQAEGEVDARPCTAIGEYAVDLAILQDAGLIDGGYFQPGPKPLDALLKAGAGAISAVRKRLYELLHEDEEILQSDEELQSQAFVALEDVELVLPFTVRSFVDFYSGIHHASNVGRMFRPDQPPLLPNYRWIPIGYNGRASTVVCDSDVRRPNGQTKGTDDLSPTFGPTKELDFELEMGFVSSGDHDGTPITPAQAEDWMAGLMVVNDWSARDVQRWEYQPLGPFLSKSFATTVSPWIVTLDALEPFRIDGMEQDPAPLPHLAADGEKLHFDVVLEVSLQTEKMTRPQTICRSNMSNLYWSMAQQLAHQTSNGTRIEAGDLCASGTISGSERSAFGSMLELSWRGQEPLVMEETGESRTFLEDGDTLSITAYAQGDGFRIGFGEAKGRILPAE